MPPTVSLNPRTTTFEWFGPVGATVMVACLPLTVFSLIVLCNDTSCSTSNALSLFSLLAEEMTRALPQLPLALGLECVWFFVHCVIYCLPMGQRVHGMTLRNGKTLTYHMNALHAFVICHGVAVVGQLLGLLDIGILADLFFPLAIAAVILACIFSCFLYVYSFRSASVLLAFGGNSGTSIYDFWVGRELNPRIGALDLKFMCELRPGLIGWSLLNWAFVVKSYQSQSFTVAIAIIALFESWYVLDGLTIEAGNLTMMDIVTDGFGFMLCFGDLAWVPFTYTYKCKFLYHYPQDHSNSFLALGTTIFITGYLIFRGANSEKDMFRKNPKDPKCAHLRTLKTSAGKSLIISGYWGLCRHPNYVGDWVMTFALSLLTGTGHVLPYFQPVYFATLLIHRQLRDEHQMKLKYGEEDWAKFCQFVPYRLIPYIY